MLWLQDDTVDNDEEGKEGGGGKWQAGAAEPMEEDDDDNVVNSPQDISTRVRFSISSTLLHASSQHALKRVPLPDSLGRATAETRRKLFEVF